MNIVLPQHSIKWADSITRMIVNQGRKSGNFKRKFLLNAFGYMFKTYGIDVYVEFADNYILI